MYVGCIVARPRLIVVEVGENHAVAVDKRQGNVDRPKANFCTILKRNCSYLWRKLGQPGDLKAGCVVKGLSAWFIFAAREVERTIVPRSGLVVPFPLLECLQFLEVQPRTARTIPSVEGRGLNTVNCRHRQW